MVEDIDNRWRWWICYCNFKYGLYWNIS